MKLSFIWPRQHRVVYFGIMGQSLLRTYIAEDDATIYVGPRTRLNIWVAFTALIAGWWGIRGYYRAFLLFTRPTFVVTLEDNALEFYLSKKYRPSCTTICIQNGRRDTHSSEAEQDIWRQIRRVTTEQTLPDVVLTHGEPWSIYYRYALGANANIKAIGSVRNNAVKQLSNIKLPRVLFVSSFPNLGSDGSLESVADHVFGFWQRQPLTFQEFFRAEGYVAATAGVISRSLGLEFCVLGKRPQSQRGEYQYFASALGNQDWKYLSSEYETSSYEQVTSGDILVNIDSTFGYEMFARGNRVAFISCRMQTAGKPEIRDCEFAYPLVREPSGFFWTNSDSVTEMRRVIATVATMNTSDWDHQTKTLRRSVLTFDPGNYELCAEIESLGIRTHGPRFLATELSNPNPEKP